jgi:hypothetical protein
MDFSPIARQTSPKLMISTVIKFAAIYSVSI